MRKQQQSLRVEFGIEKTYVDTSLNYTSDNLQYIIYVYVND